MNTFLPRLEIISAAIRLADNALIQWQISALREALAVAQIAPAQQLALQQIIATIENGDYPQAIRLIHQLMNEQQGLMRVADAELAALRLQLAALEREIADQEMECGEMRLKIERFNQDFILHLGETIRQIAQTRQKIADSKLEQARKAYEKAQREFEAFESQFNQQKQEDPIPEALPPEEALDLKQAYRRACQLCHPDRISEEFKPQAEAIFKELQAAYRKNDAKTVRRILQQLQTQNFAAASEKVDDKAELQRLIAELTARIASIKAEIAALQDDETYQLLQSLEAADGYQNYFAEQHAALENELATLSAELADLQMNISQMEME